MTLFDAFVAQYAAEASAVSFLAGLALGHWLSLGRDKRKDFNTIAAPVFDALVSQRKTFEGGGIDKPVDVPWRHLKPLLPFWQSMRLRGCAERYEKALAEALNSMTYNDWKGQATWDADAARRVVPAVDQLIKLLRPR